MLLQTDNSAGTEPASAEAAEERTAAEQAADTVAAELPEEPGPVSLLPEVLLL